MIKDEFGCLSVANFGFGYMENTHLQNTLTYPNGMVKTIAYEPNRNLISSIENKNGSTQVSKYAYDNDILGQRTQISSTYQNTTNVSSYGYNPRSELSVAVNNTKNYRYLFQYDNIGNRTTVGNGRESTYYQPNELNQYTALPNESPFTIRTETKPNSSTALPMKAGLYKYNGENRPLKFTRGTQTNSYRDVDVLGNSMYRYNPAFARRKITR